MYNEEAKKKEITQSVDESILRNILLTGNCKNVHELVHEHNKLADVKTNGKLIRPFANKFKSDKEKVKAQIIAGEPIDAEKADIETELKKLGVEKVVDEKEVE